MVTVVCLPLGLGVAQLPRLQLSEDSVVGVGSARVLDALFHGDVLVV